MSECHILKKVILGPNHTRTGKTRHSNGETELPHAAVLKIAKFEDDEGFYLLHFDAYGSEITDTLHNSIEEAFAQAEWEYKVNADDWISEGQID